jgi:hypothetical protein
MTARTRAMGMEPPVAGACLIARREGYRGPVKLQRRAPRRRGAGGRVLASWETGYFFSPPSWGGAAGTSPKAYCLISESMSVSFSISAADIASRRWRLALKRVSTRV